MIGENTMISLRLENFRCLKDTGFVDIKPLNLLLGGNSSGKSSFLRFFPLVKQSFSRNIKGPLLWAGDDDYVDFGSFEETIYRETECKSIEISFKTNLDKNEFLLKSFRENLFEYIEKDEEPSLTEVIAKVSIKNNVFDFIEKISLNVYNSEIILYLEESGKVEKIIIDSIDITERATAERIFFCEQNSLVPIMYSFFKKNVRENKQLMFVRNPEELIVSWFAKKFSTKRLASYHYNILTEKAIKVVEEGKENIAEELIKDCDIKTIINKLNLFTKKDEKELKSTILLNLVQGIMTAFNEKISEEFQRSIYIAPLRAEANRYYRIKNISINEIDYQGKNIAMLLNSLSAYDNSMLKKWMTENFDFYPEIKGEGKGHLTIKIMDRNSGEYNLTDTGFGYSQILPIAIQLWLIINGRVNLRNNNVLSKEDSIYLLIEQPELHLHPAMQAKFIDVIIGSIKEVREKYNISIILETHSETIVNRVGKHIAKNNFDKKSVNVLLFAKKYGEKSASIDYAEYDDRGYLRNWPLGFMLPEDFD